MWGATSVFGGAGTTETLRLILEATNNLTKPLQEASRALLGFQNTARQVGRAVAGYLSFRSVSDGLQGIFRDVFDLTDEARRLATNLGMTAEQASRFAFAARAFGVNMGDLQWAMQALSENMVKVAQGAKENPFAELGISVLDAHGRLRSVTDVLGDIADRLRAMPDGAPKFAWVQKTLGIWPLFGGDRFIQFLNLGREGMREFEAQADRLGVTFDRSFLQQTFRAQIQLALFRNAWQGLKVTLGAALLPTLVQVARALTEFSARAIPAIRRGLDLVVPALRELWLSIRAVVNVAAQMVGAFLRAAFGEGWLAAASKATRNAVNALATALKETQQALNRLTPAAQAAGRLLAAAFLGIELVLKPPLDLLFGIVEALAKLGQGDWRGALESIKQGASAALQDIQNLGVALDRISLPSGLKDLATFFGVLAGLRLGGGVLEWLAGLASRLVGLVGGGGLLWLFGAAIRDAVDAIVGGNGLRAALGELLAAIGLVVNAIGGWPVLIAAALITTGFLVYTHWEQIKTYTANAWAAIMGFVTLGLDAVKGLFAQKLPEWFAAFVSWTGQTWEHVKQWFKDLPANLAEHVGFVAGWLSVKIPEWATAFVQWTTGTAAHVAQWFASLPGNLAAWSIGAWEWLRVNVPQWSQAFTSWLEQSGSSIVSWFRNLPGNMASFVVSVGSWLKQAISTWGDAFTAWLDDTLAAIRKWFVDLPSKLWDSIGNFTAWLRNQLIEGFRSGYEKGRGAASGGGGVGGGNAGFASGGLISEPSWLVSMRTGRLWGSIAERGAELVVPLGGGSASRGGGSVMVNVTVNVAGSIHTERSLVDAIKRALYEEARLQAQFAF